MKSLCWKQWQESKAYWAIFLSWMVLAAIYCIAYESGYRFRAPVGHFSSLASFYAVCAAIFLAMRASQGERAAGTLSFSASLPVAMRQIAVVRIVGAFATLAIPILVAAALLSLALLSGLVEQVAPRGVDNYIQLPQRATGSLPVALEQLLSVAAIAIVGGTELMLILGVIGCRLRSNAQVGFLGAVMALGFLIASSLFWEGERKPYAQLVYGAVLPQSLMINWGYGAEHGSYTDVELAKFHWFALGCSIPVLWLLGYLFVRQYGRLRGTVSAAKPSRFRFRTPALWSRVPMRFRRQWSALLWLEFRQSGPLVCFGLLFALLIATLPAVTESGDSVFGELPHAMAFVGMLWATVVGSALFSAELGAGLGGFWRSRPISTGKWFWYKFFVGLVAVLAVLDGVTILATWNAPRYSMTTGMSWAYVGCFPIIHALLYALAVLGTCWLRKPVIGAFLAILGFTVLFTAISTFPLTDGLEPIDIYNKLLFAERGLGNAERAGTIDFWQHGYPLVYGFLSVSVFALAVISSRLAKPLEPTFRRFALSVD